MSADTLFDTIKVDFEIVNDKALAEFVGVSRNLIAGMRCGVDRVTGDTMILIHEETGWPIWKIKELIASDVVVLPKRKAAVKVAKPPKPIPLAPVKPTSFIHRMRG